MKMEVLPVQNQFMQRQFGALGTNRVQGKCFNFNYISNKYNV